MSCGPNPPLNPKTQETLMYSCAGGAASLDELRPKLVFKYVRASSDHQFMVGQKLPYGQGIS